MPKKAKELTALAVKKLTKPGLHAVGGVAGLLLQVTTRNNSGDTILNYPKCHSVCLYLCIVSPELPCIVSPELPT